MAKRYSQKYGNDYDEVFALVVKQQTFRLLLTIARTKNLVVQHYDVKMAFNNGILTEDIYMEQPEVFIKDDLYYIKVFMASSKQLVFGNFSWMKHYKTWVSEGEKLISVFISKKKINVSFMF